MPHKDPEVKRLYLRAYRLLHADRLRVQRLAYKAANRDRLRASWERWCLEHPDARRAITQRARRNFELRHPDYAMGDPPTDPIGDALVLLDKAFSDE